MSEDQGDSPPKHFIKKLDRKGGAPNWCIYERLPRGSNAVCLCYTEQTAQRIMGLLADSEHETHGQNDLQA